MAGSNNTINDKRTAVNGDRTTTGAQCIASSRWAVNGKLSLRVGDKTTPCPACGKSGVITTGDQTRTLNGITAAIDGSDVLCGCPPGTNKVVASGGYGAPKTTATPAQTKPEQHAQAAKKKTAPPLKKEKLEITLTLGVFFDGTGNNAVNTSNMLKACTARHYNLENSEAEGILGKCAKDDFGVFGVEATSYTGYYTNVHWLNKLYVNKILPSQKEAQCSIYVDGIGTEAGKPDSTIGQGLGISDTCSGSQSKSF